jgi:tetratricopeptide (TPR) repeat protein
MENNRPTLPPITAPGEVTTFYSFESGTARSVALSSMAVLLAGRDNATVPVLMIDWDTESPGLHHQFESQAEHGGVLEYFEACRAHLQLLGRTSEATDAADDDALARRVLAAVDWRQYVARVDPSRPLYLMRAGRFDDSYGERADGMDWDGLFAACPALFRCFGEHLARHFRHVLVDARCGRSAAVSICTTLLPDKLVGLFGPNTRSLDGLVGVVTRAIDYRCSHEDEQRPLLVYPLPCSVESTDSGRRGRWRRGGPGHGAGYQAVLEQLLRQSYGIGALSLESYFDEVQLQQAGALLRDAGPGAESETDRFSLTRSFETVLGWLADGHPPWQSAHEIGCLAKVDAARARAATDGVLPLVEALTGLGQLYRRQGRLSLARECAAESMALRAQPQGDGACERRPARASLAELLLDCGQPELARSLYLSLVADAEALLGAEHRETLAYQCGLAASLIGLEQYPQALALQERVHSIHERLFGASDPGTLASIAAQAHTLACHGDLNRARMLYERVLEARQRLLGLEHADTMGCAEQLAIVLCELDETVHARTLLEAVLRARTRHSGPAHPDTLRAQAALAAVVAAQGEPGAARATLETLLGPGLGRRGARPPVTPPIERELGAMLGAANEPEPARRPRERFEHRPGPAPAHGMASDEPAPAGACDHGAAPEARMGAAAERLVNATNLASGLRDPPAPSGHRLAHEQAPAVAPAPRAPGGTRGDHDPVDLMDARR